MRIQQPLLEGAFISRENRFRARVHLGGEEVAAHIPNSGRLTELLSPDHPVLLAQARRPHRVTDYDLLMVCLPHTLVSIDARLPNRLLYEALQAKALRRFEGYPIVRREVTYGDSRLDFLLEANGEKRPCLMEVKSVTLVQEGVGYFPDAVTQRGRRHLRELQRASGDGYRTVVLFVVQRGDAMAFAPHDDSDPDFGETLREVAADGVEICAHICRVSRGQVVLGQSIPVLLSSDE